MIWDLIIAYGGWGCLELKLGLFHGLNFFFISKLRFPIISLLKLYFFKYFFFYHVLVCQGVLIYF